MLLPQMYSPHSQPRYSQSIWPARWCQSIPSRSVSAQKQPLEQPWKKKKLPLWGISEHQSTLCDRIQLPLTLSLQPALTITRASLQGPAFSLTKLNKKYTEGSRKGRNYRFILWLGLLSSREEIWFRILQCFHTSHSTSLFLSDIPWTEAHGSVVVSSNAHKYCSTLLAPICSCTVCLTAPGLWSMCIPKGHDVMEVKNYLEGPDVCVCIEK